MIDDPDVIVVEVPASPDVIYVETEGPQGKPGNNGLGDMSRSTYDTNNDGKVNAADSADAAPWGGISGKPTTLAGYGITDAQAADPELTAIAGLTSAADRLPYYTGLGAAALATFTAFGRALVDDIDAATARATLGLAIGTNVQAYDAELAALAGLAPAADQLPYFTGPGAASLSSLTAFGRALIDDADAATARATLGLGGILDGTWTPVVSCTTPGDLSVSFGTVIAEYDKIGPWVDIRLTIAMTLTYTTASGAWSITLPVAAKASSAPSFIPYISGTAFVWPATATQMGLVTQSSSAVANLIGAKSGAASTNLAVTAFTSGTAYTLRFAGRYRAT